MKVGFKTRMSEWALIGRKKLISYKNVTLGSNTSLFMAWQAHNLITQIPFFQA